MSSSAAGRNKTRGPNERNGAAPTNERAKKRLRGAKGSCEVKPPGGGVAITCQAPMAWGTPKEAYGAVLQMCADEVAPSQSDSTMALLWACLEHEHKLQPRLKALGAIFHMDPSFITAMVTYELADAARCVAPPLPPSSSSGATTTSGSRRTQRGTGSGAAATSSNSAPSHGCSSLVLPSAGGASVDSKIPALPTHSAAGLPPPTLLSTGGGKQGIGAGRRNAGSTTDSSGNNSHFPRITTRLDILFDYAWSQASSRLDVRGLARVARDTLSSASLAVRSSVGESLPRLIAEVMLVAEETGRRLFGRKNLFRLLIDVAKAQANKGHNEEARELLLGLLAGVAENKKQGCIWAALPQDTKRRVLSEASWTPELVHVLAESFETAEDVGGVVQALAEKEKAAIRDLAGNLVAASYKDVRGLVLLFLALGAHTPSRALGTYDATGFVQSRVLNALLEEDDRGDEEGKTLATCGPVLLGELLRALAQPRSVWAGREKDFIDVITRTVRCLSSAEEGALPLRSDAVMVMKLMDFTLAILSDVEDMVRADKSTTRNMNGEDEKEENRRLVRLVGSVMDLLLAVCSVSPILPRNWMEGALDKLTAYERLMDGDHEGCGEQCNLGRPYRLLARLAQLRKRIGAFYEVQPVPNEKSTGGRKGSDTTAAEPLTCLICYGTDGMRLECTRRSSPCANTLCRLCLWRKLFAPNEEQCYSCVLCRGDTLLKIYSQATASDPDSSRADTPSSDPFRYSPFPPFMLAPPPGMSIGGSGMIRIGVPMPMGSFDGPPDLGHIFQMIGASLAERGPVPRLAPSGGGGGVARARAAGGARAGGGHGYDGPGMGPPGGRDAGRVPPYAYRPGGGDRQQPDGSCGCSEHDHDSDDDGDDEEGSVISNGEASEMDY